MKALNPSTGNLEKVYVKALDSMPVGAEIDFDGQSSDIPVGWEETEYDTGWVDLEPATGVTVNYLKIRRIGDIVNFTGQVSSSISSGTKVCDIPSKFLPIKEMWTSTRRIATGDVGLCFIGDANAGVYANALFVYGGSTATSGIQFNMTYFV